MDHEEEPRSEAAGAAGAAGGEGASDQAAGSSAGGLVESGAGLSASRRGLLPVEPPSGGPREAEVSRGAAAFVRGDFREARSLARTLLAAGESSPAERRFAIELLQRTDVDPMALLLGLGSFALFFLILYLTLWR